METQFIDYRFLKDLEIRKEPKCLCCCVGSELLIYADDKDSVRQAPHSHPSPPHPLTPSLSLCPTARGRPSRR